ncbi:MAG: hypothetical protein M3220_00700 [Chloroflexota bacterium]|nr:hypothetical protein [Chloroflexota bacterium]
MTQLVTTLAVWRPSHQWTVLFEHEPYAPALWALLFDPPERLHASERFGKEWPRISAEAVITDHVAGYLTTVGQARERLVERLGQVRTLPEAWRAFSLTRALALSLAAIPANWPLRFDASTVTLRQGGRYGDLLEAAIESAKKLAADPPENDAEAVQLLVRIAHGMNPETPLVAPDSEVIAHLDATWPEEGTTVSRALLGIPVDCPTSHVEAMTHARRNWIASW